MFIKLDLYVDSFTYNILILYYSETGESGGIHEDRTWEPTNGDRQFTPGKGLDNGWKYLLCRDHNLVKCNEQTVLTSKLINRWAIILLIHNKNYL